MAERPARPPRQEAEKAETKAPPAPKRTPVPDELAPLETTVRDALGSWVTEVDHAFGDLLVYVPAEALPDAARVCREHPALRMDYLRCLSGVDYLDGFVAVYHLYSLPLAIKLALKVRLPHDSASVPSVSGVWRSAEWHERELMEMFGIQVAGHPDPRPLLLEDDVTERPLLKSHPLVDIGADRPGIISAPPGDGAYAGGAWTLPPTHPEWMKLKDER